MVEEVSAEDPDRASFPVSGAVACATCGSPVDPLRADRVRILQERFRYFCSATCAAGFDVAGLTPLPQPRRRRPSDSPYVIKTTLSNDGRLEARRHIAAELNSVIHEDGLEGAAFRESPLTTPSEPEPDQPAAPASESSADIGSLLLTLAMLGGALGVALILAGNSSAALASRLVVVCVACASLVAQCLMGDRDESEPHPLSVLAAPVLATLTAIAGTLLDEPLVQSAITLSAVIVGLLALSLWLVRRARRPIDAERAQIAALLEHKSQRVVGEEIAPVRARDLRPGEEIVVDDGEIIPIDGTISAGGATLKPWLTASGSVECAEGDIVVAGARVLKGRIRVVVGWAGYDRAWVRLTNDPRRRADLLAPLP